jgi:hypothetical protein
MNGVISFAADEQARLSLLLLFLAGALSPWLLRRFPIFGSDSGEGSERKLQREAIPLVGAATLGIPLLYYALADKLGTAAFDLGQQAMPLWILAAIVCTLALGILDDRKRGGLAPLPKLGLQTPDRAPARSRHAELVERLEQRPRAAAPARADRCPADLPRGAAAKRVELLRQLRRRCDLGGPAELHALVHGLLR